MKTTPNSSTTSKPPRRYWLEVDGVQYEYKPTGRHEVRPKTSRLAQVLLALLLVNVLVLAWFLLRTP